MAKIKPDLSDWLQFFQNTKITDIHVMISTAALITAIAAIAFGIVVFSIENLTSGLIIIIIVIVVLIIGLSAYYFIEIKSLGHLPPRKEFKKTQELIDKILQGKISDIEKDIKEQWFGEKEAAKCPECGAKLEGEPNFCSECGNKLV